MRQYGRKAVIATYRRRKPEDGEMGANRWIFNLFESISKPLRKLQGNRVYLSVMEALSIQEVHPELNT